MAQTDVEIPLEDGPWDGMLDSISPTAKATGKYLLGQNVYPLDPDIGDGVIGRPGVRQMGAQLGGAVRVQGLFQFTKTTGERFTVGVAGGELYAYDWTVALWAKVLTTAQLAAAGIVVDLNAQLAFLNFSDRLVVSDGVHKLWDWFGTTGGGLRLLANSEPIFGQPVIYYDRIVGILALAPDTIIWSATDDATTGYRAAGFNNAWSTTQNDPDRLYALLATNSTLYAFRARSVLPLEGPPGDNFTTDNTRDSVSLSIGTVSPFATMLDDVNIVALDADAHPQVLRPGSAGFVPLWRELRETTKRIAKDPNLLGKAVTVYYSPAQLILIAVPDSGFIECNMLLVYDAKGSPPRPVAIWRGWEMTALAMVEDLAGNPWLVHGDTQGNVYQHGNPDDYNFVTDDNMASGVVAIEHILEQQPQGYSTKREKFFDRVDIAGRSLTKQTLEVSVSGPRVPPSAAQILVLGSDSQGWLGFDSGLFDNPGTIFDPGGFTTQETHADVGTDALDRWLKTKIRHAVVGEQFGIEAITTIAYTADDDPEAP